MRSALFAAGLATAASAAKVQDKYVPNSYIFNCRQLTDNLSSRRQFSMPVEPSVVTLPDGEVVTSDPPLGTFTSTGTIVVPTGTDESS